MTKSTWTHHPARAIIRKDLEDGKLPLKEDEMSAEVAFQQFYQENAIIQEIGFKKFKTKLKDHRKQAF